MCCCAFFYISLLQFFWWQVCPFASCYKPILHYTVNVTGSFFSVRKEEKYKRRQWATSGIQNFLTFFLTLVILRCSAVTLHLSRWCWLYFEWDSCYHTQLILINLYLAKMIKMKRKKAKKQIKNKQTECGDQKNVLSEIKCDRMLCLCSIGKKNAWHTHAQANTHTQYMPYTR